MCFVISLFLDFFIYDSPLSLFLYFFIYVCNPLFIYFVISLFMYVFL